MSATLVFDPHPIAHLLLPRFITPFPPPHPPVYNSPTPAFSLLLSKKNPPPFPTPSPSNTPFIGRPHETVVAFFFLPATIPPCSDLRWILYTCTFVIVTFLYYIPAPEITRTIRTRATQFLFLQDSLLFSSFFFFFFCRKKVFSIFLKSFQQWISIKVWTKKWISGFFFHLLSFLRYLLELFGNKNWKTYFLESFFLCERKKNPLLHVYRVAGEKKFFSVYKKYYPVFMKTIQCF